HNQREGKNQYVKSFNAFSTGFIFAFICRAFTIGANRAARISNNKWNMLMLPLLEYNKHIAKIPNCKMRSSPLRLSMLLQSLRLLLLLWMLLDAAAATSSSNGNSNGPSAAAGAAGGASAANGAGAGGGGGGGAAAGPALPPGALNANLTDLGSPGVYNSTKW
ncbi:hypothetical protein KR215_008894, partial [Drosophila sulfurigaster]